MNKHHIGAYVLLFVGSFLIGMGSIGGLEAWTTMQRIDAFGLVGQAVYESQYKQAMNNFVLFGAATLFGFAGIIAGSASLIQASLHELVD